MNKPAQSLGFTLVELVMVIILIGIMGVVVVPIILTPFEAFRDQQRRAAMVAEAESAMLRVTREVRHALPNSVRVSPGGGAMEFLETTGGGRYRRYADLTDPDSPTGNPLNIPGPDTSFDVLVPDFNAQTGHFVVIYNTEAVGNLPTNAYFGNNRSAVTGFANGVLSFNSITFPNHSPSQRFDIISGPVSFFCSGTAPNIVLTRCSAYAIQGTQPTSCPTTPSPIVTGLSACGFSYAAGSSSRNGILTINITLTRQDDRGTPENLPLVGQAQVWNAP